MWNRSILIARSRIYLYIPAYLHILIYLDIFIYLDIPWNTLKYLDILWYTLIYLYALILRMNPYQEHTNCMDLAIKNDIFCKNQERCEIVPSWSRDILHIPLYTYIPSYTYIPWYIYIPWYTLIPKYLNILLYLICNT